MGAAFAARAALHLDNGHPDLALADFEQASRLNSLTARDYYCRGTIWFQKQDFEKALADFDEALRLGTRVIVLAKEGPDQGSRVAMDLAVPDPCGEEAIPILAVRLEQVSIAIPS